MSARSGVRALRAWFDASADASQDTRGERLDWLRVVPFLLLHVGCLAVFAVGASRAALLVAAALYAVRMFAVTAFYHRYFAHKTFRASRALQLVFAVLGACAAQRGPLWWASQHRHHHAHADAEADVHSPHRHGFWRSHCGWFLSRESFRTRTELVPDLLRFPELRFLDRFDVLVPLALAAALYVTGEWLASTSPQLGTSGLQMLVWGFCVSTVAVYHVTFAINSFAHRFGHRRFATRDESRNNFWLALFTFGEGWHNNHHRFPGSARQGLRWWEIDLTWYGLRVLSALRVIRDLRVVPQKGRQA